MVAGKLLPCFPCAGNKRPTTPHGFKDATSDPTAFVELCKRYPGPLIGVVTGERSNFDVLDIDDAGLAWFNDNDDRIPATRVHETRSGGRHLFFQHQSGLRCSASKIAADVDVRGDDGYVIW